MTDGFDVLVHDVIAAIVTAPWSSSNSVPSSSRTCCGLLGRPAPEGAGAFGLSPLVPSSLLLGASDAGKDSATASSYPLTSCSV